MYGVFNVGLFTSINVVGCFLFQFQVMKFFSCRNLITLIRLLTAIFIWCNKALYTITDKDVDNNMLMLRISFRNLRFSRCLFCSSVSITKRVIFLFSLYVSFHIDTLTLANFGICCRNVGNQFFKFCFLVFEISKNFNQIKPMFFLNLFGNIISDIQLYNKKYHQKLNHF